MARVYSYKDYDQTHTRQVKMKLNLRTDADILAKLNSVPNKQGYIKELIRRDIKREAQDGDNI